MAPVKKVKLNISSVIENLDDSGLADGDIERDSVSCTGDLISSCQNHTISYLEKREGGEVRCSISQTPSGITVKRSGAVESEMSFALGKSYKTLYRVPPFSFDMTIETIRLSGNLSENGGEISLLYKMVVGGAAKKVKMRIAAEIQNES